MQNTHIEGTAAAVDITGSCCLHSINQFGCGRCCLFGQLRLQASQFQDDKKTRGKLPNLTRIAVCKTEEFDAACGVSLGETPQRSGQLSCQNIKFQTRGGQLFQQCVGRCVDCGPGTMLHKLSLRLFIGLCLLPGMQIYEYLPLHQWPPAFNACIKIIFTTYEAISNQSENCHVHDRPGRSRVVDSRQLISFTFSVQTGQLASLVTMTILTLVGYCLVQPTSFLTCNPHRFCAAEILVRLKHRGRCSSVARSLDLQPGCTQRVNRDVS